MLFIDYTMPGGRIAFQPGETTKTIAVTITDDAASEANETFTVTLTSASAARLGTTTAQTYTIIDNDNLAPTVNAGTDQSITWPAPPPSMPRPATTACPTRRPP